MISPRASSIQLFLAIMISMVCAGGRLFAIDCSVPTDKFGISLGTAFDLTTAGLTSSEIQTAANYWACPGYAGYIPTFQIGGSGGVNVTVVKVTGKSTTTGGGCGQFDPEIVNGHLESAVITVW